MTDDGLGMSEEQLNHLRAQMESNDVKNRTATACSTCTSGSGMFFRDRCRMVIDSAPDDGTRVTITIGEEGAGDGGVQPGDRG